MADFIKKLQGKPEHVRRRIVLLVAGAITAIVFVFWLLTVGSSIENASQGEEKRNVASPIPNIFETFRRSVSSVSGRFFEEFSYTATSSKETPFVVE